VFDCSLPLAADRAWKPPTSLSLADGKRVGSLLLSTAARDPPACVESDVAVTVGGPRLPSGDG
jgi:hypothetical protein